MPDPSSPIDPTRHASQTDQPVEAIPIPEADARSRRARTVRIQDILAAHARALDVRLEEGMREMRLAMESALRRSSIQEAPAAAPAPAPQVVQPPTPTPPPAPEPPAPPIPRDDVARGIAQQTEERFQSLALRLQRIEDSIRAVAVTGGDAGELAAKLDALNDGMSRVAASEEDLFDRLLDAQREGLEDLTRRVGAGVSAVIRAMQNELNATITRLELTADATAAVSPGDTARLERTMMAIAEHQEAVLDDRLAELRQSMTSLQQTEQTAGEAEDSQRLDDETAPEGPRIGVEEAFPWPEPVPEEPLADVATDRSGEDDVIEAEAADSEGTAEATSDDLSGESEETELMAEAASEGAMSTSPEETEPQEVEREAAPQEAADADRDADEDSPGKAQAEPGQAEAVQETPSKKRRRRRKKKQAAESG